MRNEAYQLKAVRRRDYRKLKSVERSLAYLSDEFERNVAQLFTEPEPAALLIKNTIQEHGIGSVEHSLNYNGNEPGPWRIKGSAFLLDPGTRAKAIDALLNTCREIKELEATEASLNWSIDQLHTDIAAIHNEQFRIFKDQRTTQQERQIFEADQQQEQ